MSVKKLLWPRLSAIVLITAVGASALAAEPAPLHSDAWCADAVDFAMRTVERRVLGKSKEHLLAAVRDNPEIFKQQYPDLELDDMQLLIVQAFDQDWTRFRSAQAVTRRCVDERRQQPGADNVRAEPAVAGASS